VSHARGLGAGGGVALAVESPRPPNEDFPMMDWFFVVWVAICSPFMIAIGIWGTCEAIVKVRKTYREW
jgi:hypothetical protein